LAAWPRHADVGPVRRPQAKMDPAELAAGMAAADRELAPLDPIADAYLRPCPDRVRVRPWLHDVQGEPVAHRARSGGLAATDVPPEAYRRPVADLDQVEHPVEVEVGQRGSPPPVEADDAGRVGGLAERAVGLSEQE